jgi:hypothetical protein
MSRVLALVIAGAQAMGSGQEPAKGVRGTTHAVAAAARLLEHVGGAAAWRRRQFEVTERGFLANGDELDLHIVRDFVAGRRLIERRSQSGLFVEWISAEGGWTEEKGDRHPMASAEHAVERQGLAQEPYVVYHRLAGNDRGLRVELRERDSRLLVYDERDAVLCWFRLDAIGRPTGWGNFFDGAINEHHYGPYSRLGAVSMPRWGVSTTGAFRFEYVSATLQDRELREPR